MGSGLVGGKSCGMLLARKIIEKDCPEIYANFEPDDSFYIGSDLFYTYIVSNDLWDLRVKQRTPEGYYEYGKQLEEVDKFEPAAAAWPGTYGSWYNYLL